MMRAAVLLCLCASPAAAMIATPYTPGGSPCNGACSLEWAADQAGVETGVPAPLMVPAGAALVGMSYARDGVPMWTSAPLTLSEPQSAVGYRLADGRWMVRLAACTNWTLAHMPVRIEYQSAPGPVDLAPVVAGFPGFGWSSGYWGDGGDWYEGDAVNIYITSDSGTAGTGFAMTHGRAAPKPPEQPEQPTHNLPVPGALPLLIGAMMMLRRFE